MALLHSKDLALGTPLSHFHLSDPFGKTHHSQSLFGKKGLLIAFTCNHCPYALAVWPRLLRLAEYAQIKEINTIAINPNIHPQYPADAPDKMIEKIKEWQITFPYLVDATQKVAQSFEAQCTPDLYLFNHEEKLVYHGRIDDNWQDENKVTKHELKNAIDALALGNQPLAEQHPSLGCSIKWREAETK